MFSEIKIVNVKPSQDPISKDTSGKRPVFKRAVTYVLVDGREYTSVISEFKKRDVDELIASRMKASGVGALTAVLDTIDNDNLVSISQSYRLRG
jgi:hypothetical protein